MCKKFILASSLETIEKRFNIQASARTVWTPPVLISPGDETLIITQQEPKTFTMSKFGMSPSWAKEQMHLINARAEGNRNPENDPAYSGGKSIFMKPAFKRPLMSQRCIVIADAIVEYSSVTGVPFVVYLRNRERPFGLAGLYDTWINPVTKAEYHGFCIITVPGNALLHQLPASRMPVIIPKGREVPWVRASNHLTDILAMLEIFPAERMNAYPLHRNYDKLIPLTSKCLMPAGDRIYTELEKKVYPHRRWGHKEKGAGGGTWRGGEG